MRAPDPSPSEAPPSRAVFFQVFPSVMLPMFLAMLDQTIVATALPAIAGSLGGVERVSWVVVSYLIATTVAAPVYGRLGDLLGRRRLMVAAILVFIAGSILCALARSVEFLTAARVLQGLGGGGLMTLSQALIGEAVPPRERARYQSYLAANAVCASTLGPVAGGFLTEAFGWTSVFLVNVPLGLVALLLTARLRANPGSGAPVRLDPLGFLFFILFVAPLLLALEGAHRIEWHTLPGAAALVALALASLFALVWQEGRAASPLLPIGLLRQPAVWRSDAMAACHGATLVSLLTFVPLYLRVARGLTASETGLLLLPLTVGVGIGAMLTGQIVSRTGRTAVVPSYGLIPAVLLLAAPRRVGAAAQQCGTRHPALRQRPVPRHGDERRAGDGSGGRRPEPARRRGSVGAVLAVGRGRVRHGARRRGAVRGSRRPRCRTPPASSARPSRTGRACSPRCRPSARPWSRPRSRSPFRPPS